VIEDQNALVRSEAGSGLRHSLGLGRKDPFDNLFPSGIQRGCVRRLHLEVLSDSTGPQ
jgi:hypothetical protein